jgi:tetratricopeptide (TPR) repeat protein
MRITSATLIGLLCFQVETAHAQQSQYPTLEDFNNILTACAAGASISLTGEMKGNFESVYKDKVVDAPRGAVVITSADFLKLLPEKDRLEGFRLYQACFVGIIKGTITKSASEQAQIAEDYQSYYDRAKVYKQRGQYKQWIQAAEDLLHNQEVLGKLPDEERRRSEILLHAEIALDLLAGENEGISNPWQKALFHAEQAHLSDPDNFMILFLLGDASAAAAENELGDPTAKTAEIEGQFRTAKQKIDERELSEDERQSILEDYHYWFGRSLVRLKEYDRGKVELDAALLIIQRNMSQMSRKKDPVLIQLGLIEWMKSLDRKSLDMEAAIEYWKDVADEHYVRNALAVLGLNYFLQSEEARKRGNQQDTQNKSDAARMTLAAAKRMGNISAFATHTLGLVYFSRGDFINAAGTFEDAIRIDSSYAGSFYWLGRSLMHVRDRATEARHAMEKAVQLNPGDADAHTYLSLMYGANGELSKARSESEEAIKLNKNSTAAWEFLTTALMGLAAGEHADSQEQMSMYEQALSAANSGISTSEEHKDTGRAESIKHMREQIWNALSYIYAEREAYISVALEYINLALKTEPIDPHYLDTKAWVLIKTAELSKDMPSVKRQLILTESEQLLDRAMASYSAEDSAAKAVTYYHQGYKEKLEGRTDKARELFLNALRLDPKYEKAKNELK